MKYLGAAACAVALTGCTTFPHSAKQGEANIRDVVKSVECELAAAAVSVNRLSKYPDLRHWNASVQLDITRELSVGADGNVNVGVPYGPAGLSATPKLGGTGTDTKINTIQFAPSIAEAVSKYGESCSGPNPSETNMGLANWIEGSVLAVGPKNLVGVSFTNQYKININGGSRFGYTLVPVRNPTVADLGFTATRDDTTRFTIALTPPPPPPPPMKPIPVRIVGWTPPPPAAPKPPAHGENNKGITSNPPQPDANQAQPPAGRKAVRRKPVPRQAETPRERAIRDPQLQMLLQQRSPVYLSR